MTVTHLVGGGSFANKKHCVLFGGSEKNLRFANKRIVFCSATQREFFESRTKALYFVQPHSEKDWNLRTTATQINCIL
jgi:hypothetical protein